MSRTKTHTTKQKAGSTISTKSTTSRITLTVNQATQLQAALAKAGKSYKWLNAKLNTNA